jgi:hypothetical protein
VTGEQFDEELVRAHMTVVSEQFGGAKPAQVQAVVWPGGADLAPDTLYVRVKTGSWPGTEIAA